MRGSHNAKIDVNLRCGGGPTTGMFFSQLNMSSSFGSSVVSKVSFPGEAVLVTLPESAECGETNICLAFQPLSASVEWNFHCIGVLS